MSGAILKSLLFGILVAAAIGPIAILIVGTAAERGLRAGFGAGLGAALADLVYALLAFSAGAVLLPALAAWRPAIHAGSALLLIGVATAMAVRELRQGAAAAPAPRSAAQALLPTFLLTLANPMTLAVFAGFAGQLPVAGSLTRAVGLAGALFSGSLLVQTALATAGALLGTLPAGSTWRRAVKLGSAAGIGAFGFAGLLAGS